MKRIYLLNACSTCQRILKAISPGEDVELINIKESNIDGETLDWLKEKVGSYEGLFSKKAMKYRSMGLHEKNLTEEDYRNYMLEEYTFLKRPFCINGDEVFIGNAKKEVEAAVISFNK
jgi:arsenate reductase